MSFILPELTKQSGWLDPQKLLDFVELPLDEYDVLLRKNKKMRLRALFQEPLPPLNQNSDVLSDPSFIQALRRLAATITIQTAWRGYWTMFKYSTVMYGDVSLYVLFDELSARDDLEPLEPSPSIAIEETVKTENDVPPDSMDSFAQPLITSYQKYIVLCETSQIIPPCLDEFCAIKIQATWKMYLAKKELQQLKELKQQGIIKPHIWIEKLKRKNVCPIKLDENSAASRIQSAWRRFRSRKIYFILKDFISSKEQLHPSKILKYINPREVQLIDPASIVRIRIRLGGSDFPPQIYYKLYNHSPTIDLNSFSPRNYVNPLDKEKTWYKRFENNGWRPLLSSLNAYDVLDDPVFLRSTYRSIKYPPLQCLRKEESIKRRKEKQRAWLRQLYKVNIDDLEFDDEDEVHDIVDWSHALDFDAYLNDWYGLATVLLESKWHSQSVTGKSSLLEDPSLDNHLDPMDHRISSAKSYRTLDTDQLYLP